MQKAETILSILSQKSKKNPQYQYNRIYRLLYNKDFYRNACLKLAVNSSDIKSDIKDEYTDNKIDELIRKIKNETYYPKIIKNITTATPDRSHGLVQEILKKILEAIYEPLFSRNCHGFRRDRSCHTALNQIKKDWRGVKWVIEGDISNIMETINHETMMKILGNKITDNRFLRLINRHLQAGCLEENKKRRNSSKNPKGGTLGSVLINIYLNELDGFLETIWDNTGESMGEKEGELKPYQLQDLDILKERKGRYSNRIKYCRYEGNFLIGVEDKKDTALRVKEQAQKFLKRELKIDLKPDRTKIINLKDSRVRFLNYEISKSLDHGHSTNIKLLVPHEVVNKYISRYTRNGKAVHLPQRVNQPVYDTIAQYSHEIRTLYNYYSLAEDVNKKLKKVRHFNYDSMVKTLAFKHKCSYKKVMDKYGIEVPLKQNNGTRKLVGVSCRTESGYKTITYFNESLIRRDSPLIDLEEVEHLFQNR